MSANDKMKLLRVAIVQDRRVVEERLIRGEGDITLGTGSKNTFVVQGNLPKQTTVFEGRGQGRFALVFERGQDGRIELESGSDKFTPSELADKGKAQKKGKAFAIELTDKARGKVSVGDVSILFQFVDPPNAAMRAPLPMAVKGGIVNQIEWPFLYIMAASFILLGGSTTGLDIWWKQTGQYYYNPASRERSRLYDLIRAEVQAKKEKEPEKEKPEDEKKDEAVAAAEAAEAVPAPEPEKPKAAPAKKPAARVGKDTPRETNKTKLAAAVKQKTFLHVLGTTGGSGPGELDTLRGGVHAQNIANAFDLEGGIAQNRESGAAGSAFVGGPQAATAGDGEKYKTLSQAEAGGERIATTQVKTADKANEVKINANVRDGSVSGQEGAGSIDKDSVARVFSRRKSAIKYCYERALKLNSNVKGKVVIRFTIGTAGRITSVQASQNTTGDPGIADCIIEKVQGWRFDPPSGGSVTFSYPFLLDTK
jgi:TonB family protein